MDIRRAACIQFAARPDKADNLRDMAPFVADAAERGADMVLLPEKWNAWVDGAAMRREAERSTRAQPSRRWPAGQRSTRST